MQRFRRACQLRLHRCGQRLHRRIYAAKSFGLRGNLSFRTLSVFAAQQATQHYGGYVPRVGAKGGGRHKRLRLLGRNGTCARRAKGTDRGRLPFAENLPRAAEKNQGGKILLLQQADSGRNFRPHDNGAGIQRVLYVSRNRLFPTRSVGGGGKALRRA